MKGSQAIETVVQENGQAAISPRISNDAAWKKLVHSGGWLIGGVALYFFLVEHFDWSTFRSNMAQVSWSLLAAAVCAYILGLVVRAIRWTYMVRCHQSLAWAQGYHVTMIANMANFFFPVRLGEILKLVIIKKTCGVAYCSSTAASIIEKITLFLIIVVFLSLAPWAGYRFNDWSSRLFPFMLVLLVLSAIFLFMGPRGVDRVKYLIEKILRTWCTDENRIQRFFASGLVKYAADTLRQCHISSYATGTRFLWIAALGLIILGLDGLANYFLLAAFGLSLSYLQAVIAACFFNVLFLLPSPPVQVGTAEMYPVLIYAAGLKLAAPVVASSALVWHMLTIMLLAVFGYISLYAMGLRTGAVIRMTREKTDG